MVELVSSGKSDNEIKEIPIGEIVKDVAVLEVAPTPIAVAPAGATVPPSDEKPKSLDDLERKLRERAISSMKKKNMLISLIKSC